ncbi:MAG: hypothetical protein ACAH59_06040 [Pseudobdellovibrionaceae bacterium]
MLSIRFLFLFLGFWSSAANAAEFFEPFQTVRQLGMGGVYVFNSNDSQSFMQNPAYTCFTSGMNFNIFNIQVGVGDIHAYTDLTEATGQLPTPESFADLDPFYGKSLGLQAGGFTSVTLPCFGMAGFYSANTHFELQNPAYPKMDTFYVTDYGVRIGGGFNLSPFMAIGLDVKRVTRKGGPYTFSASELTELEGDDALSTLVENNQNEGVGYGLDAGLVTRFDMLPFNPTISMSWQDVGSMSFVKTKGEDEPARQKDNFVLGMTIDGSLPLLGMAAGIEYRHITDTGEQIGKKLHIGGELSLAFLDFRAGLHQGYPTYGVGLNLWIFQLDAALYSVERGVYPGQTPEQRGQIGLMLDLEFDPNFRLVDAGGRKRRLKQRR